MKKSLLIVDDEKLVRWTLAKILANDEVEVVLAAGGKEAIDRIDREDFDLIITDLAMPDCSGLDILLKAREIRPGAKVIMMTGYSGDAERQQVWQAGACEIIDKPFRVERVMQLVRQTLGNG